MNDTDCRANKENNKKLRAENILLRKENISLKNEIDTYKNDSQACTKLVDELNKVNNLNVTKYSVCLTDFNSLKSKITDAMNTPSIITQMDKETQNAISGVSSFTNLGYEHY